MPSPPCGPDGAGGGRAGADRTEPLRFPIGSTPTHLTWPHPRKPTYLSDPTQADVPALASEPGLCAAHAAVQRRVPTPTGGGARYDWPPPEPPFTDADRTLGAGDPDRPGAQPYRVTFTSKARHIETRRYCDGHLGHVDTITGEAAPDPFEGL